MEALKKLWRKFLEPYEWKVIETHVKGDVQTGFTEKVWVLQNQFGDIKFKRLHKNPFYDK